MIKRSETFGNHLLRDVTMDCDEIKETPDQGINSLINSLINLQTNEKDDLVVAFQNIANELSYTTARFFLEMNNW